MNEIKAPHDYHESLRPLIFLAGSIEMGAAQKWQEAVVAYFDKTNGTILNPRRDDWDSSWVQDKNNKQFSEQVNWELDAQEAADLVVVYFAAECKAPITLLELGILLGSGKKIIVCCPFGFWRKGNVDITCMRHGQIVLETLPDLMGSINLFCAAYERRVV